jgi:hypothetical protein
MVAEVRYHLSRPPQLLAGLKYTAAPVDIDATGALPKVGANSPERTIPAGPFLALPGLPVSRNTLLHQKTF